MNPDTETKTIESLEEKNRLLLKIIALQDEVERLNKEVRELNAQIELLKNTAKADEKNLSKKHASEKDTSKSCGNKDYTKYSFDGIVYKKNRLVLAVITKFVEMNGGITAEKLMEEFPKNLQGSLGTVRFVSDVEKTYAKCKKRFFMENHELIETPTGVVTVCSQWHSNNIENFLACARAKGMVIIDL